MHAIPCQRNQRTTVELEPRSSKSQTRLPCVGWQKCFCKSEAIQADTERARFLVRCHYGTAVLYLHFQRFLCSHLPPIFHLQLEYSQACQRQDRHTDKFHSQDFFLQYDSRFAECRTVQCLLALSAGKGLSKPLPLLCSQHWTSGQPGFMFTT